MRSSRCLRIVLGFMGTPQSNRKKNPENLNLGSEWSLLQPHTPTMHMLFKDHSREFNSIQLLNRCCLLKTQHVGIYFLTLGPLHG